MGTRVGGNTRAELRVTTHTRSLTNCRTEIRETVGLGSVMVQRRQMTPAGGRGRGALALESRTRLESSGRTRDWLA